VSKVFLVAKCRDLAVPEPSRPVFPIEVFTQEALSELMVDAYRGTADWEDGDDESVALAEIRETIKGAYGPFLGYASGVITADSKEPVSGLFVSLFEQRPTVLFVFTRKGHTRQGHAATLIRNAAGKLLAEGYEEICLFVSTDNPAINLYRDLGFTSK
jgi:ribosomal protein S18 acetylase RimI-like enzyme